MTFFFELEREAVLKSTVLSGVRFISSLCIPSGASNEGSISKNILQN